MNEQVRLDEKREPYPLTQEEMEKLRAFTPASGSNHHHLFLICPICGSAEWFYCMEASEFGISAEISDRPCKAFCNPVFEQNEFLAQWVTAVVNFSHRRKQ